MKKFYLFLILAFCFPLVVNAEVVTVGDANYVIKEGDFVDENLNKLYYPFYIPGNYLIGGNSSGDKFASLKTYKYDGTSADITAQEMYDLFYNSKYDAADTDITYKTDYIDIKYYRNESMAINGIDSETNQTTKKIFSNKLTYEEGTSYYTYEYNSELGKYVFTLADVNADNFDYLKHLIDVPENINDDSYYIVAEYELPNTDYDSMFNDALERYVNLYPNLTEEAIEYFDDFYSWYVSNKRYYYFTFENDGVYNIFTYDEEYNIVDELLNSGAFSFGNYVFVGSILDHKFKICDSNFNAITTFNDFNFEILYASSDNWLYFYYYDDDNDILKQYSIYKYAITSSANPTFEGNDVTVSSTGFTSMISKVYLNDTEVSSENYTTSGELTNLTLKSSYLNSLDSGNYNLKIEYSDGGYVNTTLKVEKVMAKENPKTGIILPLASILVLLGAGTLIIKNNKNKKFNRI